MNTTVDQDQLLVEDISKQNRKKGLGYRLNNIFIFFSIFPLFLFVISI